MVSRGKRWSISRLIEEEDIPLILASVAQFDARLTGDQEVTGLTPNEVEIDLEIFSTSVPPFS